MSGCQNIRRPTKTVVDVSECQTLSSSPEHLCVEGQMGKRGLREGGKKNLRQILNYLNRVSYKKMTESV